MTWKLGVIGDPIAHSLSPRIHSGWIMDAGLDASYEALHVPDGTFDNALKDFEKEDYLGVNVTLPHKHAALAAAADISADASVIGAANTLTQFVPGSWRADNTDAPGFIMALGEIDPRSDRVVVLGAGGSARAIVFALMKAGLSCIVLNRTVDKATQMLTEFRAENSTAGPLDQYKEYIESATIVVNTTSMGYSGEILELPPGKERTFFDISYGKIAAPQLDHAHAQGWAVKDGLTMLVAQAALSFEIWFGTRPDLEAGLRRCRDGLEGRS